MEITILYTIKFNTDKYKGEVLELEIDLEDIEIYDLVGYLVDNNYLDGYSNDNEFEVISRQVL